MKKLFSTLALLLAIGAVYLYFFDETDLLGTGKKAQIEVRDKAQTEAVLESIQKNRDAYPVYKKLRTKEKDAYVEICAAIQAFDKSTYAIYQASSMEEANNFGEKIASIYREIVYEQPEVFWVNPYKCDMMIQETDEAFLVFIKPEYLLSKKEALAKKEEFDQRINTIVAKANAKDSTFEKILYVYDQLLANCTYNKRLIDDEDALTTAVTAYGCLVEGETVCSGYAMAFQAIMNRLGFECGVEFNNYSNFSIFTGHVWNYCKIEDDYYYFDLTWDDTVFNSAEFKPWLDHSHQFFAVTKDELKKTNFTMTSSAPTPACNGTKYNYFIYNGYNFAEYDFEAVKAAILEQAPQGYAALRFDSYGELLRAESDLLEDGKIHSIIPGQDSITYVTSDSSLHLYLFLKN